jgi:hypothetical protein
MNMQKEPVVGDWVEVRSKEEILKTLDGEGRLEGLPFMPEMFQFCGKRFRVYKRAHKTCDYTHPFPFYTRRLKRSVHLETRCDGGAHGGCQAGCLLIWKEAWLMTVSDGPKDTVALRAKGQDSRRINAASGPGCHESVLWARTQRSEPDEPTPTYVCQATTTPEATTPLAWWDLRQYLEDYWSGNVSFRRLVDGLAYSLYWHLSQARIGLGRPMRWFWNKFHWAWGGTLFPRMEGRIPHGQPTPTVALNLQPGELVRVRPHKEILKTVDKLNRNRGMTWDAELVPYCGKTYRVLKRVDKLIDERTGKMLMMKTPCIILDSVVCQGRYSMGRMLCPKAMYPYWREIWLERVETDNPSGDREQEIQQAKIPALS